MQGPETVERKDEPMNISCRRPSRRVRTALVAAFLGAVVLCGAGVPSAATAQGGALFAADSFWNKPLPADAPLDPSSSTLVRTLRDQVAQDIEDKTGPSIATGSYSTTLYTVPADQPTVRVALDDFGSTASWRDALQAAWEQVPIPPGAESADGEGHMTIWQPSTDKLWDFFMARNEADGWHARWGGAIQSVSHFPGYYSADAWPGASHHWGATATGLPVIGGVMTLDEFEAGEVDHALALNIPKPRAKEYSWPAQGSDGTHSGSKWIPEGARFRIEPSLDLDSLTMHPVTRMMAEAVQSYGMVVRDRTSTAVGFAAEDPAPLGYNPYREPDGGYFEGKSPTTFLKKFPWKHLQLLKMSICTKKSEPCPPPDEGAEDLGLGLLPLIRAGARAGRSLQVSPPTG
jgi:hypothetical protein